MIMNRYKMRSDIRNVHLSGMSCRAAFNITRKGPFSAQVCCSDTQCSRQQVIPVHLSERG
jgi:hypothetical protein